MAYVTEKEMRGYILQSEPFKGSSVKGIVENGDYMIYSYDTLIYRKSDNYFNNTNFSVTTSKIQNILIDCFKLNGGIRKRDK